jgi:hypothetical protein
MRIATGTEIVVPGRREDVFDFACSCETFVKLFRAKGLVGGIVGAEMLDGAKPATGARRRISLDDGSVLVEDILRFERPTRHVYRWSSGLRGPAKLLVRYGEGDWTFSDRAEGTHIDWRYTFELTSPLAYPAGLVLRSAFRAWMQQQLHAIRDALAR